MTPSPFEGEGWGEGRTSQMSLLPQCSVDTCTSRVRSRPDRRGTFLLYDKKVPKEAYPPSRPYGVPSLHAIESAGPDRRSRPDTSDPIPLRSASQKGPNTELRATLFGESSLIFPLLWRPYMRKNGPSSGQALIQTVAEGQLGDAIFDLAEVALDTNLAEGVLKEIPILGTVVKIVRAGKSLSEELFLRKLGRFLMGLSSVPMEERNTLLKQYPDGSEEQKELGENLLLALERLDDIKKPEILARFFTAYIRLEIDYLTFTRLTRSLEKFNLELLPTLQRFYIQTGQSADTSEEIIHELSLAGLVAISLEDSETFDGYASYTPSKLGEKFLLIGFGIQTQA